MSLCFTDNPFELFSCSQDGAVKLWDLRKYTEVCCFKVNVSVVRMPIKENTTRRDTALLLVEGWWLREALMELSSCTVLILEISQFSNCHHIKFI